MFGFFKPKSNSPQTPPPLPEASPTRDPFVQQVIDSGEHVESALEGLYGIFRLEMMAPHEFFPAIFKLNVFVICSDKGDPNSALFLEHPDGNSRLAFFSTAEKAKTVFFLHPSYSHLFEIPLRDLIVGLPATSGFVLNPTFKAMTMQASPEQVQHLKADFLPSPSKKKTPPPPPSPEVIPPFPAPVEPPRANAPNSFTEPKNELERAILAKHRREIDVFQFMEVLFNSHVIVMAPEGQFSRDGDKMNLVSNPRLFSIIEPTCTFLAFFTSIERSAPVMKSYPEFRYAISIHAGDFIKSLAQGAGLVINPYWDINMHWSPEQVAGIKQMITK